MRTHLAQCWEDSKVGTRGTVTDLKLSAGFPLWPQQEGDPQRTQVTTEETVTSEGMELGVWPCTGSRDFLDYSEWPGLCALRHISREEAPETE